MASPRLGDVVGTSVGPVRRVNVGNPGILAHCQPGTSAPCRLHTAVELGYRMERSQWGGGEGGHREDSSGLWESERVRWTGRQRSRHLE